MAIIEYLVAESIQGIKSFVFRLSKISAFPEIRHARTILLGVEEADTNYSIRLSQAFRQKLRANNFIVNFKPWHPHLTLARVKAEGGIDVSKFQEISVAPVEWQVNEVQLIQSTLTPIGPEYMVLKNFKF